VVGRLSGRRLLLPAADELVALGAAVQAAAVLNDTDPSAVAEAWGTMTGETIDPVDQDTAALDRITETRRRAAGVLS
jgi:xylulokinase